MASSERAGSMPKSNHGGGEASSGVAELRRSGNELAHSAPIPLSTTRTQEASAAPAPPPPPTDEGPSPFVQQGVQRKLLKAATVQQLDGTKQNFYIHKKADGEILFDMVAAQLELIEKDYFGLVSTDSDQATGAASAHHWLYKDKKIERQLKGRPWYFAFVLKFYPPDPEKLGEDIAHDLMYLQLKHDVQTRRLPVTLPIEAKLAALAAQAEFGDYPGRTSEQYKSYLRQANIAQPMTESLIEKIAELHTQHKGLTPQEAKLAYLNECKDIAMYGIWQFPTKERSVNVGVNYHGLHVHSDQMRVHRFAWPSINRFSYRGNTFCIRLNAGELNEKKEKTVTYKMPDYRTAARLFNLAVEHHTFFRLIQPEARDKKGIFKLCTSNRFRYQGRTNIQSHMASQLFDQSSQHVDGNRSNALGSMSADDIQRHAVSALHHTDDGMRTPPENPIGPPLATSTVKKKKRGDDGDAGDEVGGPVYHSYRLQRHNQQHARHTQLSHVTTSASTAAATIPPPSPTTPVTSAVAASFTAAASNNAHQKQKQQGQHDELVEDYLGLSPTSGSTHPVLLPSDTSTSTAVDYNTTTAVSDDGSVIIRTTTTRRIVTTTASTAHQHPFDTSHTEALSERQSQHRFTSASLISNTLSSTSSNTSFTSALDDTLVLLNDSGYEPSVSVGGALGGGGGSLRPDAAQSPSSSKYTSRVTSPSYVLNSSFDESRVSPYEGERFSVATTSLPYSSGGAQQKVRFATTAASERSRSPFKGLFARERGKSTAQKDSSLRPLSTSSPLGLDVTWRQSEVPLVPIGDRVQLYNSGVYTSLPPGVEDVNQLGETHTFTLLPDLRRRRRKKRIPTAEKISRQSRTFDGTMGYLTPRAEVVHIPLRYCVACYHSGFSHRPWIRRRAAGGREEVTSWLNKENYTFPTIPCLEHSRLEKDPELETAALRAYVSPYHVPYYDRKGLPPQPLRTQPVDGPKRPETVAILHLRQEPEPVERAVMVKEESEGKLPLQRPAKIKVSVGERLRAKLAQRQLEDESAKRIPPADIGQTELLIKSDDMKEIPIGGAVAVHHTSSRESPSKRDSAEKMSPTKERLAVLHPKPDDKETQGISKTPSKDNIATLHLRRLQPGKGEGAKKIRSSMTHDLEKELTAKEVGSTSEGKPGALLHLRRQQQPSKTTEHVTGVKGEERGSVYTGYPVRSDPYMGEVTSLHHRADPSKEPIEQYVSIYRVAVYPASKHRAHRAAAAAEISISGGPSAEISKPIALLHLKHSQASTSQPAVVRIEAVRRKPRAGKTYWIGGRLGSALRGWRRDDAALAKSVTQDESLPTITTPPPKPPRSLKSRSGGCMPSGPKAVLHLKKHHGQSEGGPEAVRPTVADFKPVSSTYVVQNQPYSGPLQSIYRSEELAALPINQHACVYHSGWSVQRHSVIGRLSTAVISHQRERKELGSDGQPTPPPTPSKAPIDSTKLTALLHLREKAVVEKRVPPKTGGISKVTRSPPPTNAAYCISTLPFTGDLETLGRKKELESESITNFISPLPSLRLETGTEEGVSRVEAESGGSGLRQRAILHLMKRDDSPLDEEHPAVLPVASRPSTNTEKGKRTSAVKKSPPAAHYPFDASPFDGYLPALGRQKDIEAEPITTHVLITDASAKNNEVADWVDDAEAVVSGEKKLHAILHLKPSTVKAKHQKAGRKVPPTEVAEAGGKVLKNEEAIVVRKGANKSGKRYALSASIYTGRLHPLSRGGELEADPIESHVSSPPLNVEQQPVTVARKGPMAVATIYLKSSPPATGATQIETDGGSQTPLVSKESPAIPPSRYHPLPAESFIGVLQTLGRREEAAAEPISIHVSSPPVNIAPSGWRKKKPNATLHLIKPSSPAYADETGEAFPFPAKQKVPRIVIDRSSLQRNPQPSPPLPEASTPAFPIYEMDTAPYTGPLETIHPAQQMKHEPLSSRVKAYHTGHSVQQKGRRSLADDEGGRGSKLGAILYLRGERAEVSVSTTPVSKTHDRTFKGPKREKGPRVEVVEPGQYTPYALDSRPYEGYLHTLSRVRELKSHTLPQHVALYHHGTSFGADDAGRKWVGLVLKSRREAYAAGSRDGRKPRRHTAEREELQGIGGGRDPGAKPREHKATAVLHLKRHSPTETHSMPISDNSQLTTAFTAGVAAREEKPTTYSTSIFIWRKREHHKQSPLIITERYDGPMASMGPQRHLDSASTAFPLRDYVHAYNPGTSYSFTAASTPPSVTARPVVPERRPLAVLHLKSEPPSGSGDYENEVMGVERNQAMSPISTVESEGLKSEKSTALLHLRALSPSSGGDKENRPAAARSAKRDHSHYPYQPSTDPGMLSQYEGPLVSLQRNGGNTLEEAPLEDYVKVYHPSGIMPPTQPKKVTVHIASSSQASKSSTLPTSSAYVGPLEALFYARPMADSDIGERVDIGGGSYHTAHEDVEASPSSRRLAAVLHLKSLPADPRKRGTKYSKRAAIAAYPLNTNPYDGPYHVLNRALLFHGCPIESSVAIYHPGYYYSPTATTRGSSLKKAAKKEHDEMGVSPSQRPAALLHLKSPPSEIEAAASVIKSSSAKHLKRAAIDCYPYNIEPYKGPLQTLNRAPLFHGCPIESSVAIYHPGYYSSPAADTSPSKKTYRTVHGEIGVLPSQRPAAVLHLKSRPTGVERVSNVEPSNVKHSKRIAIDTYPSDLESYNGPLHTLNRALLFQGCPIEMSVATYHPGYYPPKTLEGSPLKKSSSTKRRSYALLHMKSGQSAVESQNVEESSLEKIGVAQKVIEEGSEALESQKVQTIAIIRLKNRQSREAYYHEKRKPYTGPLDSIRPASELDFEPIMNQVSTIYYQSPSPPPAVTAPTTKKPSFASPVKKARALIHLRQSTEAEKTAIHLQRAPVGYPYLTDPYAGELHFTSPAGQLTHDPLPNLVCVYHTGDSHSLSKNKPFVVVDRRRYDVESQSPVKKALAKLHLKDDVARPAESDEVLNWVVDESSAAGEKKQSPQPSSTTHKPKAILHTHITAISQKGPTQPTSSRVSEPPEESEKTTKTYSSWLWWSREEPTEPSITIKTTPHEGPLSSMQPTDQLPTVPLASSVVVAKVDGKRIAPRDLKPAAIIHVKAKATSTLLKGAYVPSNSELMMQESTGGDGVGSMAPIAELSKEPIESHVSVYGLEPYVRSQAERADKTGKAAATLHLKKRKDRASTEQGPKPVPPLRDEAEQKRPALMAVLHLKDLKIDEGGAAPVNEAPTKKRVVKAGYPSYSDLYRGEIHKLSRTKHDLRDSSIEEHVAVTAKPTIVRVEWEPEKSHGLEATKDECKGTGILHMRTNVPKEETGEAPAVDGPSEPQRPKTIATLHLRRSQLDEDGGPNRIGSPGTDNLEEEWKAGEVGPTSEVKPAALLHLRKQQQPSKTTEHVTGVKGEERGSLYTGYPVRNDPYMGEVTSLHHRADPSKEPIEQHVSIYRAAVYPASKHRAHRAAAAAESSISGGPSAEITKPIALLHLKHSQATSQPAVVRIEAVRRKPRAGKTHWIGGRLSSALRGRQRLATPIAQVTRLEQMESTIRTSRVEMNLLNKRYVNEAEMGVELRREARIDYTCEAFLVRRTHRFQPPALQSLNDDGAYDGPAFLPKSLFEKSSIGGPSTSTAGVGLTFIIRQPGCQSAGEQQKEAGGGNPTTTGISSGTKEKDGEGGDKSGKSAKRGARKKRRKQKSRAAAGENREPLSAHSSPSGSGEGTAAGLTSTAAGGIAISSPSAAGSLQLQSSPASTSPATEMRDHGTAMSVDNQQPQQSSSSTAAASGPSIFSAIRRRLSQVRHKNSPAARTSGPRTDKHTQVTSSQQLQARVLHTQLQFAFFG